MRCASTVPATCTELPPLAAGTPGTAFPTVRLFLFGFLLLLGREDEGLTNHLAPIDGGAQGVELLLVAGGDAHDAVLVQIPGQVLDLQTALSKLFNRELKQGGVVGLVVELTATLDHAAVFVQEAAVGQAALGVLLPLLFLNL